MYMRNFTPTPAPEESSRRDFLLITAAAATGLLILPRGARGAHITSTPTDNPMTTAPLKQPPLNTTMMGVYRAALDFYQLPASTPALFGLSGHAFVINIHKTLCPSGPYCWGREYVENLTAHLGLEVHNLGFFNQNSTPAERAAVEAKLRAALDAGEVCSLINMENQLITGYDDAGFHTAQPWPQMDFPPKHLNFGSWSELGNEIHVNFFNIKRRPPADLKSSVLASLRYLVDFNRNPAKHSKEPYACGLSAYPVWINAIREGHGNSHGHWWNAFVYQECRAHAAEFFREVTPLLPNPALGPALVDHYTAASSSLKAAANKQLPPTEQIALLTTAETHDRACVELAEKLLAS